MSHQLQLRKAKMRKPSLQGIRLAFAILLLGCLVPIFGRAEDAITNAVNAAEAAKTRMLAACTAQNQTEVDRQLAIVLQILATNQVAKALLAEPSATDQRSVLLSGYSGVQQNEKTRTCFFKIMHALYGEEDSQRVLAAFIKMGETRGPTERKAAAEKIRKEFEATGRMLELKRKWQCLIRCKVFQMKTPDGQQKWFLGSVSPDYAPLIFGNQ